MIAHYCTAILFAAAPLVGPNDALRAAVDDLETRVAVEVRSHVRYVTFYHLPPAERRRAGAVLSLVLNSVSRADAIVRPEPVPATDDRLWRFSLADYRLPADVWELLASHDPYFHLRTRVQAGASFVVRGAELQKPGTKHQEPSTPLPTRSTEQEAFTDGGWLDLAAAARLRALAGSGGALLRGDYFITQATTTLEGGVYYELAGIADTEEAFFTSIGLDIDTVDRLRADAGANTFRSLVTFKPRRIVRRQGPLGGAWHTYDTAAATPERDPIRNPFDFVYDAGEHIAAKRNGLHLYALFDRAGRRQASVPDNIAKDTSDPHGSGIVAPLISCVRCHLEDGLRPVVNDQRRLLDAGIEVIAERPRDAERLAAFYFADLEKQLRRDREDFAEAVASATGGLSGAAASAALAELVSRYRNDLVDAPRAAAELGIAVETLRAAFRASHDPILQALAADIAVDRKQWEASFAEAALLITALPSPPAGEAVFILPSPLAGEGAGVRGKHMETSARRMPGAGAEGEAPATGASLRSAPATRNAVFDSVHIPFIPGVSP